MMRCKLIVSHRAPTGEAVWSSLPVAPVPETLAELAEAAADLATLHEAHYWGDTPPRDRWTWMARPAGFDGFPWYGIDPVKANR